MRSPASVMIGELFPIEAPRRSGDGEITVSVMFSFALLLGVGLVPALAAQLVASIVQDGIARKPWWQIGFNIGQYTLVARRRGRGARSCSAATPRSATGLQAGRSADGGRRPPPAYFVGQPAAGHARDDPVHGHRRSRTGAAQSDLTFGLSVSAVLLCLAPVVVTVLQFSPILYPLLLVPLVGVYISGRQTVRTATAEHLARHDSLTELPNRRWFLESVGQSR